MLKAKKLIGHLWVFEICFKVRTNNNNHSESFSAKLIKTNKVNGHLWIFVNWLKNFNEKLQSCLPDEGSFYGFSSTGSKWRQSFLHFKTNKLRSSWYGFLSTGSNVKIPFVSIYQSSEYCFSRALIGYSISEYPVLVTSGSSENICWLIQAHTSEHKHKRKPLSTEGVSSFPLPIIQN